MKVAAIIQARMRSTRLPGKVLREVSGRALIGHTIDRLRACKSVTDIAIVTSVHSADDALADFAKGEGIPVFRGDEADVLGRYGLAVAALRPDVILRVTGDCPLLSPDMIESYIRQLTEQGADFMMTPPGAHCIQEGVDAISARAFDILLGEARNDPIAREHVTSYFKHHPDKVAVGTLRVDERLLYKGARISVDTPADLRFLAALEDRLGPLSQIRLEDVGPLLKKEPWLLAINAHVHQKAVTHKGGTVLIRADGGAGLGFGHLKRCLSLAHALREHEGLGVVFQTGFHPLSDEMASVELISADDFPVLRAQDGENEEAALRGALERTKAGAAVFDIRTDLSRKALERVRAEGVHVTVIDDASDRRLAADVAIYPPVPDLEGLGWGGFSGDLIWGPQWALLSPAVVTAARAKRTEPEATLLITMGGSDPYGLTGSIAEACASVLVPIGFSISVLIGPGVKNKSALAEQLPAARDGHTQGAQGGSHHLLVLGMGGGVKESDGDSLDLGAFELRQQSRNIIRRWLPQRFAVHVASDRQPEAQPSWYRQLWLARVKIVQVGATLSADFDQVFEAGVRDEGGSGQAFAGQDRVERDGAAMDHVQLPRPVVDGGDAVEHGVGRVIRRRGEFVHTQASPVEHGDIGERATGVNADPECFPTCVVGSCGQGPAR